VPFTKLSPKKHTRMIAFYGSSVRGESSTPRVRSGSRFFSRDGS
jgi:hypothetical protein